MFLVGTPVEELANEKGLIGLMENCQGESLSQMTSEKN